MDEIQQVLKYLRDRAVALREVANDYPADSKDHYACIAASGELESDARGIELGEHRK
jgi:hypothetical protein